MPKLKQQRYDPRMAYNATLGYTVKVGQVVATFNAYSTGEDDRTFVGRVVSIDGKLARLRVMDVGGRGGQVSYARGPALRFYTSACWPVPTTMVGATLRLGVKDPETLLSKKEKQVVKSGKFKSTDPDVKNEVNAYLATLLEHGGGTAAMVLDTALLPSSMALLATGKCAHVYVPNHDLEEVALMKPRKNVTVKHCSAREMLEAGGGMDGRRGVQLVFLDYCGAWNESKLGDVKVLLSGVKLSKRACVALTICRRTKSPREDGLTMEDAMRRDFERACNSAGYLHVCLRTFRYAGAMITCVYELLRGC